MTFTSEPLAESHVLSGFDSGQPTLDDWLRQHARHAEAHRTGRTRVWHAGDDRVLGYYTLVGTDTARADLPPRVGRGCPSRVPSVLLAKLALDRRLHGQKVGADLLYDALERVVDAARLVAVHNVVAEPIDQRAAGFYTHHGFLPTADGNRVVQKVSDMIRAFARRQVK